MAPDAPNAALRGLVAMIVCCTIWGLSPLYYKLLAEVPPLKVLAHRTLWSLVFFAGVIALQGRLGELRAVVRPGRGLLLILAAAVMISTNWFLFIFSVQAGRGLEASMGYYIFPLVAVLFGVTLFSERLSRAGWAAIVLAALGVAQLAFGLGAAPWISLGLAGSFGLYGVLKKMITAGPVLSVTAEVLLLAPLALGYLLVTGMMPGGGSAFGTDPVQTLLLLAAGPITGAPLILFSYASRRLRLASVGLLQYLNPTLQFIVAVAIFGELFTPWHGIAFAMIWTALALYSGELFLADRRARRARRSVAPAI
ncbi:EamA family transporter RarD [Profundibacterium mesophilum]|uniref:RarD protein DMT superfamily transporter n=1 Tax=Profundibacterium mesophilum KAUST100406-0324 TaxID=1037889 RepID=A0A921NU62_9RHOB|nr:EamA family transporter RarD [Profundibacterium mesophilum]KAF0674829.1 RarD protein DMT superfamily transporter [Profundibacterium mesophilum KAUST100406-0324]